MSLKSTKSDEIKNWIRLYQDFIRLGVGSALSSTNQGDIIVDEGSALWNFLLSVVWAAKIKEHFCKYIDNESHRQLGKLTSSVSTFIFVDLDREIY